MTLELPVLRLGLAGFTAEQRDHAQAAVRAAALPVAQWRLSPFGDADAWWVNGARTLLMPDGRLRIGPGQLSEPAVQLDPADVDRPVAFARPLPPPPFEAACAFDVHDPDQLQSLLAQFTAWLRPLVAQFSLSSCIIQHHAALGGGAFQVLFNGTLLAVVDMRGDVGVLPTAGPGQFGAAMWRRSEAGRVAIPEHFARVSLSQLMWNFALRTERDLLPAHYRSSVLYFRRPPKLQQRLLRDSHLLLLRELAGGCGTLQELQQRTGMAQAPLARDLAALYLVGAITSNPKRAAQGARRRVEVTDSLLSNPPSESSGPALARASARQGAAAAHHDMTAPAHLPH